MTVKPFGLFSEQKKYLIYKIYLDAVSGKFRYKRGQSTVIMERRSKTVVVDLQANILNFNTMPTVTYKKTTPKMGLLFYV